MQDCGVKCVHCPNLEDPKVRLRGTALVISAKVALVYIILSNYVMGDLAFDVCIQAKKG